MLKKNQIHIYREREGGRIQTLLLLRCVILECLLGFTTKQTPHRESASPEAEARVERARLRGCSDQKWLRSARRRRRSDADESGDGVAARKRLCCCGGGGIRREPHCRSHCYFAISLSLSFSREKNQSVMMKERKRSVVCECAREREYLFCSFTSFLLDWVFVFVSFSSIMEVRWCCTCTTHYYTGVENWNVIESRTFFFKS